MKSIQHTLAPRTLVHHGAMTLRVERARETPFIKRKTCETSHSASKLCGLIKAALA